MSESASVVVMNGQSAESSIGLWKYIDRIVRWFKIAVTVVTVFGLAFLVLETVRMYQTLAGMHPALGVMFVLALGVGLALVFVPGWRFLRMPRVVTPPPLPSGGRLTSRQLALELRYLDRYLANCARNPAFSSDLIAIASARRELAQLSSLAVGAPESSVPLVSRKLTEWSTKSMDPVLKSVDARADQLIYQEALAVGLATAASPNGVLDAFVMLWRGVKLVSEMGLLYYGRPGLFGTIAICRDVSMAVAVAGYMQNISESLGGVLAKTLGSVGGVIAGPAVDGITNALVLIRIGYLAKERCRSYRRWDAATQRSAVVTAVHMTQKIAVGLATEILRHVGWGVTALVGKAATKVGEFGSSAMETVGSAADKVGRYAGEALDAAGRAAKSVTDVVTDFFNSPDAQPPRQS